jgi:hypothetical protein
MILFRILAASWFCAAASAFAFTPEYQSHCRCDRVSESFFVLAESLFALLASLGIRLVTVGRNGEYLGSLGAELFLVRYLRQRLQ